MKKFIVIALVLFTILSCKAQMPPGEYTSKNKKAIALFESALEYYNARNDAKAEEELKKP